MTYTVVRPSSPAYQAQAFYAELFASGVPHVQLGGIPVGNGSLSDDSDATYIEMRASLDVVPDEPDVRRSSMIAVDFDPIPNLTDEVAFGDLLRVEQTDLSVSGAHVCMWMAFDPDTDEQLMTNPGRFDYHVGGGPLIPLATHLSSDFYQFADGAQAKIRESRFRVVFYIVPTITHAEAGDPLHYTFYEFGLNVDMSARLRRRPLRQFPRSDGLGMSSARRQDANRSMQASLRRGGGVYF